MLVRLALAFSSSTRIPVPRSHTLNNIYTNVYTLCYLVALISATASWMACSGTP
jgi:cobalamin synthase